MRSTKAGRTMTLFFHFLGNPYIELDGKKLSFPLKKAEYMATYLAFNGPASRNQLKVLFWPDMQSAQSSANLRNGGADKILDFLTRQEEVRVHKRRTHESS